MKFGCSFGIFLNSAHLICRSTDISNCFSGSLRLRDINIDNVEFILMYMSKIQITFRFTNSYCILSRRKSSYLSIPEKIMGVGPFAALSLLLLRNGQILRLSYTYSFLLNASRCTAEIFRNTRFTLLKFHK